LGDEISANTSLLLFDFRTERNDLALLLLNVAENGRTRFESLSSAKGPML
jgi:hypothetical protein